MFRDVECALKQGQLDKALTTLRRRFRRVSNSRETQGLIYGFPMADAIYQEIGARVLEEMVPAESAGAVLDDAKPGVDAYLASTLYEVGGHTGLIGDLVRAGGERSARLLLT